MSQKIATFISTAARTSNSTTHCGVRMTFSDDLFSTTHRNLKAVDIIPEVL
jgi:hypothetical protein